MMVTPAASTHDFNEIVTCQQSIVSYNLFLKIEFFMSLCVCVGMEVNRHLWKAKVTLDQRDSQRGKRGR